MEDVLDLYHEEYDRERPVVCFDETSKQLRPRPGRERKLDGKQEARLVAITCSSPPEGHVMCGLPLRPPPDGWSAMTLSTSETGPGTCSCSVNRRVGGGTSR